MELNHPGIVRGYDVFQEHGTAYFVMEYVDGASLEELIAKGGPLPDLLALEIIGKVALALNHVHSHRILHLDIKPANILINQNGEPILIDFGVSKQYDKVNDQNTSGLMGRTPCYAPPEQTGNKILHFSASTDIYALGATLYKMLSGEDPLEANLRVAGVELAPLPESVSKGTRMLVQKSMSLSKKDRPQTVSQFLALLNRAYTALKRSAAQPKTCARANTKAQNKKSPVKKVSLINALSIIFLILAVVGILYIFLSGDRDRAEHVGPPSKSEVPTDTGANVTTGRPNLPKVPEFHVVELSADENVSDGQLINEVHQTDTILTNITWDESAKMLTCGAHTYRMILVEGGRFTMGATPEQGADAYTDEKPVHTVNLGEYYIGATEVPQWLWSAVMDNNPSFWQGENQPVEQVSYDECLQFIERLNGLTGAHFSLPTEAQWEYAARGGKKGMKKKYSGADTENELGMYAWYDENSNGITHDVGTKRPNELGVYDMSGNVSEWCSDWYNSPNSAGERNRVNRGGSFNSVARGCRVSYRDNNRPGKCNKNLGFRLAL